MNNLKQGNHTFSLTYVCVSSRQTRNATMYDNLVKRLRLHNQGSIHWKPGHIIGYRTLRYS